MKFCLRGFFYGENRCGEKRSLGRREVPAAGGAEVQERGQKLPLADDDRAALRKQSVTRAAQKAPLELDSSAGVALLSDVAEVADELRHTHRPRANHALIKVDHIQRTGLEGVEHVNLD